MSMNHDVQKYKCRFKNIVGITGGMEIDEDCKKKLDSKPILYVCKKKSYIKENTPIPNST